MEHKILEQMAHEPIKFIAMSKDHICYDDNLYDCADILVSVGDAYYVISSHDVKTDEYDFTYSKADQFDAAEWPLMIASEESLPIIFAGKESGDDMYPALIFHFNGHELIATADDCTSLTFGWVPLERDDEK